MIFLVTDDSPATRRMIISDIKEKRKTKNDTFLEAGDGVEALQIVKKENNIDLIFLDWSMPRLDGLSFVDTVRGDAQLKDKIIIMVTSEAHQDKVISAIKAGVDAYVLKPFTPEDLWEKLSPFCKE
jgi:two-component system chemotaxis response regulator CheY